ncbi:MAG: peptide-methionine (R)-S-oxide reductase MsrB [Candidatus Thermoplasmatota archaeon]|jgi:peptide-methionine (R)-S-oxide reductase|nr:peptide-methionine (R)-S-oxide reductase MsrB [Candidatus Thermoplasmatota archaeon]|tara:strand:- start:1310 stop:1729 length:420 start_codon:yes stop_codon:yes gene_type:complete
MTDSTPRRDPERDTEWRSRLTTLQYHITREAGTEMPNTGIHNMEERDGSYYCICCEHILFTSEMKYRSGCGWPAFHTEHTDAGILRIEDSSHGMRRVEVRCGSCDAHLGHVFDDGPTQFGGERYCINSASMDFVPEAEE